jgi:hypothetical protein
MARANGHLRPESFVFFSGSLGLAQPGVNLAHLIVDSFDTHADHLKEAIDLLFRAWRRKTPFRQHVAEFEHEFCKPILLVKPKLLWHLQVCLLGAAKLGACFRHRTDGAMEVVYRSGQPLHLGRNGTFALDQPAGHQTIFVPFTGTNDVLVDLL